MHAAPARNANLCKKLFALPNAISEWQQTISHPDCPYYHLGQCRNPASSGNNGGCPLDGNRLLPSRTELEEMIYRQIRQETAGRIQGLNVTLTGRKLVIDGIAPCYHVKQLALKGVLAILGSTPESEVELCLKVTVIPTEAPFDWRTIS